MSPAQDTEGRGSGGGGGVSLEKPACPRLIPSEGGGGKEKKKKKQCSDLERCGRVRGWRGAVKNASCHQTLNPASFALTY